MMLMQPSCRQQAARCPAVVCSARPQRPARRQSHNFSTVKRAQQPRQVIVRSTTAEGTLITKTEIPAFIPRADLMDQLTRWATIEIQESGVANVGMPCKVAPYYKDGLLWGFTVSFLKDGASVNDVRVAFDDEKTLKHEWVGRGADGSMIGFGVTADGFPAMEGNAEEIKGKHFEIRKVDDRPATEQSRTAIRDFCQMLVSSVNKYYAFGSVFVDDST